MFFMCIAIILFSAVLYFLERGRFFYCTKRAVNESLCHEGQAWDPKVPILLILSLFPRLGPKGANIIMIMMIINKNSNNK
jgi:hypothetical protein